MAPKSILNDLRRRLVAQLLREREAQLGDGVVNDDALRRLRVDALHHQSATASSEVRLHVLVRSMDQLHAVLQLKDAWLGMIYADFEDIRRYRQAVGDAHAAGKQIALATLRIIKPAEEGLLRQVLDCGPDAVLVRNLAAIDFYREYAPGMPLLGDYSLNVTNELTAAIFAEAGLARMVPGYDLSWSQMRAMLARFDPGFFEVVVHQHMPMFHIEHCVFCATLSSGKDYRDCGRPCDHHRVELRDRVGQPHPLVADVGCRNTVFNAQAQSALEYLPRMREAGSRHFRIELLRERWDEVGPLVRRYADVLLGNAQPRATIRRLNVLNQLGVTAGTLDRE